LNSIESQSNSGASKNRQGRRSKSSRRQINGIVLLDKPFGLSSNAALQEVKWLFAANKAGHTGSLDPLATGVLPLCLGEATKVSQFLLDSNKGYRARIQLGVRTDSGDRDGNVLAQHDASKVTDRDVERALQNFRGVIQQVPPMHSALKVDGVPLYKMARKGIEIEREAREIEIFDIALTGRDGDEIEIEVFCSKGTYIRTIADDLGLKLGCGAHVAALRRTQAGVFREQDCVTVESLKSVREAEGFAGLDKFLVPMDQAVEDLPEVRLPSDTADCVKHGQAVLVRHLPAEGLVRLYDEEQFIGIGSINDDGKVAPRRLVVNH
jgi:tRNA pseudouridine55 synthase